MKRLVLIALVLFVVLGVGSIYAQGMGRAFAVQIDTKADGAVKVDGVLDKENEPWKFAIPIYVVADTPTGGILTPVWQQFGTHNSKDENPPRTHRGIFDSSAIFYILWDATNLYVASAHYDDIILGGYSPNAWENDGWELYVGSSTNFTFQPLRTELTAWDGKIPAGKWIAREPDFMQSAVVINYDRGFYTTESIINLKAYGLNGKIKEGLTVTFDIEIDDSDDPTVPRVNKLAWASGGDAMWNTPALAGEITFLGRAPKEYQN
jgi:hypothetical protein